MTREEAIKALREKVDFYESDKRLKAAVETLIPELTESDDERIIKALQEYVKNRNWALNGPTQGEVLAWLETQKPSFRQINDSVIWDSGLRTGIELGKKEKKPILEVFGFKVGDAVRLKDGDGRKHIIKSFEEVEGVHGPNFYHVEFEDNSASDGIYPGEEYPNGYYTQMEKFEEEQKPVECIEFENEFTNQVSHLLASVINKENEYNRGFVEYVAQSLLGYAKHEIKPAEWSEEDERIIHDASIWISEYAGVLVSSNENKADMLWKLSRKLLILEQLNKL